MRGTAQPLRQNVRSARAGDGTGAGLATSHVEVNGLRLFVQDEGEGAPVVLLHGWPDSHHLWRNQVPALVAAGHRVVALDLRGFGESDKPDGVDAYAIPYHLADVQAVADHL